jgi:DNA repair exonuclease SbcCD ATPase subunit
VSQPVTGSEPADSNLAELQAELDASRQSENDLTRQIQHYKTVLSDTESILKKLQETVETEEQRNLQKLQASELHLNTVREEVRVLREEMKGMHKTTECFACIVPTPAVDRTECTVRKDKRQSVSDQSMSDVCGDGSEAV